MTKPIHVNGETFETAVVQSDRPVLVDFYADWCAPCRMIAPVLEQLADELDGQLTVAKLDVDANQQLAFQHGVQSIPTLILFRGGQEAERFVGFAGKGKLLEGLQPHLDTVNA